MKVKPMMPSQFLSNDVRSISATSTFLTSMSPTSTDSTVVARAATGPPAPCAERPVAGPQHSGELVYRPSFSAIGLENHGVGRSCVNHEVEWAFSIHHGVNCDYALSGF